MTSKIKVDNINKVSDDSNIIKKCGTTTTIGSGASNPIVVDGSAITLGRCGGTVALASGATQTGFGRTGTVDWITTPKTATFTAVSGEGYFCNTSGGAFTVNLPAGSAGAIISLADYAATWQTSNVTVAPNGTDKIGSLNENAILNVEGQSVTFVFVDSTQGWINTMDSTSNVRGVSPFIVATGGTETTSGNCKIHTFTGPGTFTVNGVASCASNNIVSYMVVAGGGGSQEGGGGAGGFREVVSPSSPYTGSPLNGYPTPGNRITVTETGFPITVGGGGAAGDGSPAPVPAAGTGQPGNNSTFSSITSAGGGGGGRYTNNPGDRNKGIPGGSGGGSAAHVNPAPLTAGGTGNTPPVTPPQGQNGGPSNGGYPNFGGGGGGAGAVGTTGNPSSGAPGGDGVSTSITGASVGYAGGGGGGVSNTIPGGSPVPATFGGGNGANTPTQPSPRPATAGVANRGGGAGGTWSSPGTTGGSGMVVIRYKFQ